MLHASGLRSWLCQKGNFELRSSRAGVDEFLIDRCNENESLVDFQVHYFTATVVQAEE